MSFNFKFSQADFSKFKQSPEEFFRGKGIKMTAEQEQFFKTQDFSKVNFEQFKDRIQQSKLFAGFFDFT